MKQRTHLINATLRLSALAAILSLSSCALSQRVVNPFYEDPKPEALLGEPNDHALNESGQKVDTARQALEQMATYRQAHAPQPVYPVMQPAVVRLMWIPDHLNKHGDLVPAHYYYLKVKSDQWAVTDAFELEQQLNGPGGATSNIPFITSEQQIK